MQPSTNLQSPLSLRKYLFADSRKKFKKKTNPVIVGENHQDDRQINDTMLTNVAN